MDLSNLCCLHFCPSNKEDTMQNGQFNLCIEEHVACSLHFITDISYLVVKKIVNTVKGHEYNANTPGVHICFKIAIVHVTHSLRTLLHVHAYIFNTYT